MLKDANNAKKAWGQGQTNPFAAVRGDKMAMWPFVKIVWLVSV